MQGRKSRGASVRIRKSVLAFAALAAAPIFCADRAAAASLTWDNNGAAPANPQDGPGSWDTALLNFWNGATNVAWNNANNDTAVFGAGGNGGAVTVSAGITVGGLQLNSNSYSFTGGSFVTTGATQIGITASVGTINTPITGAGPITFNVGPTSTLNLTGTNTYAGGATVSGGETLSVT